MKPTKLVDLKLLGSRKAAHKINTPLSYHSKGIA
jgi:hypothetical protein